MRSQRSSTGQCAAEGPNPAGTGWQRARLGAAFFCRPTRWPLPVPHTLRSHHTTHTEAASRPRVHVPGKQHRGRGVRLLALPYPTQFTGVERDRPIRGLRLLMLQAEDALCGAGPHTLDWTQVVSHYWDKAVAPLGWCPYSELGVVIHGSGDGHVVGYISLQTCGTLDVLSTIGMAALCSVSVCRRACECVCTCACVCVCVCVCVYCSCVSTLACSQATPSWGYSAGCVTDCASGV